MNGYARRMIGGLSLAATIALSCAGLSSAGPAAASARCQGRYRDVAIPSYDRLVVAFARRHLTCSKAMTVGNAVATAYERDLPVADYPPPPRGVPGGKSQLFPVHTRYGTFTCQMLGRGSDFVTASCRRGAQFVRLQSTNDYFLHGQ